ncbi:hypothetical protein GOEFS_033_00220 [Gordonia effusa NBRC 100432]|uniref:Uncharacterized protein n=1 Tax=Gordonia effusa NBRC 100432 TaxID=1077974 RepID=H0QXB0_9ACTN|nr:hypothetical protein GOEFS_033_00220 [Gordonia effusa NBRC 100432]
MLPEQSAALTLGHAAPNAELDTIVEGIGSAFELNWAVPADSGRLALRRTADKKLIWIGAPAFGVGNPR